MNFLILASGVLALVTLTSGTPLHFKPEKDVKIMEKKEEAWPPTYCKGYECPKFTILKKTKEYEVRQFPATTWVAAVNKSSWPWGAWWQFMKLFHFIQGNNALGKKMEMTVPVLSSFPADKSGSKMHFFMSPKLTEVPKPKDPDVVIKRMEAMTVYVRSFPGYAWAKDFNAEAKYLQMALKAEKIPFVKDVFYAAGYDAPFSFFKRHNEVWIMAVKKM